MFAGFENEGKRARTTESEAKPTKEQETKEMSQPKDGYISKVLAGELKNPPVATQLKILKELGIWGDDRI